MRCVLRPPPPPALGGRDDDDADWVARGLSSSGDGSLVASTLCWSSSALLSPWGGEGGGGGEEACGVPGRGEEDEDEVQGGVKEAWRGREEEEGGSVGGWDPDGDKGRGASLGVAGDSDGWGPDDRASDAPPFRVLERGGLSSRPPSIAADLWTAMARTVGIRSG